ncbi:MAG: hypothetical protein WDW36_006409 [Sanguina aurantia]
MLDLSVWCSACSPPPPSPPAGTPYLDLSLTFQTDYARLTLNATMLGAFRIALVFRVAAAAAVAPSAVALLSLYSGSVSTDLRIYIPHIDGEGDDANTVARVGAIISSPSLTFGASFSAQFGITGVSAMSLSSSPADHRLPLTPVIAGSVCGAGFVAAIVLAVVCCRSRQKRTKGHPRSLLEVSLSPPVSFTQNAIFDISVPPRRPMDHLFLL